MRIPLGDQTVGYVSESQYITYLDKLKIKVRSAYFQTNDIYEKIHGYNKMTYQEFKKKYPIASERYCWLRYVERPYN